MTGRQWVAYDNDNQPIASAETPAVLVEQLADRSEHFTLRAVEISDTGSSALNPVTPV